MSDWASRLAAAEGDAVAFGATLAALKADRSVTRAGLHRIAADYLGRLLRPGTKARYLQQIEDHFNTAHDAP